MKNGSNEILNAIVPCLMFCLTCTGGKYGERSLHAKVLLRLLDVHEEFFKKTKKIC